MSPNDDWVRWAGTWQAQPAVDAARLQRRVRRKRRQMQLVAVIEALISTFAVVQVVRLQVTPGTPLRWKLWSVFALLLVAGVWYTSLRVRRGTWNAAAGTVPELLQLTAQRARAGIRLAWVNILSFPLLLAMSLPFAWPWLEPSRWQHNPALQHMLILNIGINGAVIAAFLVFYVFYIRRQRRRLHDTEVLLREFADLEGHPVTPRHIE